MSVRTQIKKGSDATISLTITDEQTKLALDLTTLQGYVILLYYVTGDKILAKFSKNTVAGFDTLNEIDAAAGKVEIYLDRAITEKAAVGKIDLEVQVQEANSNFAANNFRSIGRDFEVGEIVETISKGSGDLS